MPEGTMLTELEQARWSVLHLARMIADQRSKPAKETLERLRKAVDRWMLAEQVDRMRAELLAVVHERKR